MSDLPSEEDGVAKTSFTASADGLVVYSTAVITDRGTALMVVNTIYNEILATPKECFDSIDLTYRLHRKIPEPEIRIRPIVRKEPIPEPLSFWGRLINRLLGKDNVNNN